MKKILFITLVLFSFNNVFAQSSNFSSGQYSNFSNTNHQIKVSNNFISYEKDGIHGFISEELDASVQCLPLNLSFDIVSSQVDNQINSTSNVSVIDKQTFLYDGEDAVLYALLKQEGVQEVVEYMLVVGDSKECIVVKGNSPNDEAISKQLKSMILSIKLGF